MNANNINLDDVPPIESATIVLLRPKEHSDNTGVEVLMLKKNSGINYGGSWVFPGGVVDEDDQRKAKANSNARIETGRITAARETAEETGLEINTEKLIPFANWLTPKLKIKRYNTLFFAAILTDQQISQTIRIDGEEIVDYQWVNPQAMLDSHNANNVQLNGPSFVTLSVICEAQSSDSALQMLANDGLTSYKPRGIKSDSGLTALYQGDSAYQHIELSETVITRNTQPQHRLYMRHKGPWEFIDTR